MAIVINIDVMLAKRKMRVTELAEKVGAWMEKLQADGSLDQRAVALGKTNLQQGFMWAIRGIAKPTTF